MGVTYKDKLEIEGYANVDSSFVDFKQFEDADSKRDIAKKDFIGNSTYTPVYYYPALDNLYDLGEGGDSLARKKTKIYEAVLELEANKNSGVMKPELFELYADFHELRLKRIMLVEAAQRVRTASSSSEQVTAREEFMFLNKELYGDMNQEWFNDIMAEEAEYVESFEPNNEASAKIKSELLDYFRQHKFEARKPGDGNFTSEEMMQLQETVHKRCAVGLAEIPDTDDSVYYNAEECADILNKCLQVTGMAEAGWVCSVNAKKSNPVTSIDNLALYLPSNTRRNAYELRKLWLHEGEVHIRRGFNGKKTGVAPLAEGTANYADVEEGLGVLLECIEAGSIKDSPAYARARDRYITAGLALGMDGVPKDGRQTYEIMWRLLALRNANNGEITKDMVSKAKNQATVHDENAFRGTNFAMPGVIYSKLKVYYEGLRGNIKYIKQNMHRLDDALDDAMLGKINHTDKRELGLVKKVCPQ